MSNLAKKYEVKHKKNETKPDKNSGIKLNKYIDAKITCDLSNVAGALWNPESEVDFKILFLNSGWKIVFSYREFPSYSVIYLHKSVFE